MLVKKLVCDNCKTVNDDDAKFCKNCGVGAKLSVGAVGGSTSRPFHPFETIVMKPDDFKVYTNGISGGLVEDNVKTNLLGDISDCTTTELRITAISPYPAQL